MVERSQVWIREVLFWLNIINLVLLFAYGTVSLIIGLVEMAWLGWVWSGWAVVGIVWKIFGGIALLGLGILYVFPFRTILGVLQEKTDYPRTALTQGRSTSVWVAVIGILVWIAGFGVVWGRYWLGASFIATFVLLLLIYNRKQV